MHFLEIEHKLLKIALLASLVGILLLTFLGAKEQDITPLDTISKKDIGKTITTEGKISYIKRLPSVTLASLENKLTIVIFEKELRIKKGNQITVTGKVKQYNGDLELIADTITKN